MPMINEWSHTQIELPTKGMNVIQREEEEIEGRGWCTNIMGDNLIDGMAPAN